MSQLPVSTSLSAAFPRIGRAGAAVALAVGFAVAPFLATPAVAAPVHTFYPVASAPDAPQDPAFLGTGTCHSTNPDGACTLRAAVMEANEEGVYIAIVLSAGTYHLTIPPTVGDASTGDLDIFDQNTVTFTGAGITRTFVDGTGMEDRVFTLDGNAVARMTGFTIQNGHAALGPFNGYAGRGGGILLADNDVALLLQSMRIRSNTADVNGGGIDSRGALTATDAQITGNTAAAGGGGLFVEGGVQLTRTAVNGNTAANAGGGIEVSEGSLSIEGGSVSGNHLVVPDTHVGTGGGIAVSSTTTIHGTSISDNTIAMASGSSSGGGAGGGMFVSTGLTRADHLTINRNRISGLLDKFQCCNGDGGGGIWDNQGITLTSSVVSGNRTDGLGGGIVTIADGLQLTRVTVSGNTATQNGGGIFAQSRSSILQSSITGNSADAGGGGIFTHADQQIDQSLIAGNAAATGAGAGIYSEARLILTNDTITQNRAVALGAVGGGLFSGGTSQLTNVTLSQNRADEGGGFYNNGAVVVHNTIIAFNTDAAGTTDTNCRGVPTSVGNNIDSGHTCGLTGPGDKQNTNPRLGALANNGGPTRTQALLYGSPAINAGSQPAPTVDQRGVRRDSRPDIGAFEKR